MTYFKYAYEKNKLDPKYSNPPLSFNQEMGKHLEDMP